MFGGQSELESTVRIPSVVTSSKLKLIVSTPFDLSVFEYTKI